MATFKKILAVLVMGLCILGILLAFSGIVGSWVLNRMAVKSADAFLLRADSTLGGLDSGLGTAESGLSAAGELLKQFEGIPLLGGLVGPLNDNVGGLSGQLTKMHGQVVELQGMVDTLQANFRTWLNLATLGVNIFLLWFGLAQVSLFYHALDWYREPEPGSAPLAVDIPVEPAVMAESLPVEGDPAAEEILPPGGP